MSKEATTELTRQMECIDAFANRMKDYAARRFSAGHPTYNCLRNGEADNLDTSYYHGACRGDYIMTALFLMNADTLQPAENKAHVDGLNNLA